MPCLHQATKRSIRVMAKLALSSFSQNINYIKQARILEKLKSSVSVPDNTFERGKYLLLVKSDLICIVEDGNILWKDYKDIKSLNFEKNDAQTLLLGVSNEGEGESFLFAVDLNIPSPEGIKNLESVTGGKFITARESLLKLSEEDCQYVSQARGLSHFCKTYNYCPGCGHKLVRNMLGTQKKCQKCEHTYYPHVTPVGLVLIENETHDKVLLVRQRRHPPGMFSCVAGFLEPGETIEQGIKREIAEEVGVEVSRIDYCISQHWAMPSSQLMLGCIAAATSDDFEIDEDEIIEAKWVQANDLKEAVNKIKNTKLEMGSMKMALLVPPPATASHALMVEWLRKHHSL